MRANADRSTATSLEIFCARAHATLSKLNKNDEIMFAQTCILLLSCCTCFIHSQIGCCAWTARRTLFRYVILVAMKNQIKLPQTKKDVLRFFTTHKNTVRFIIKHKEGKRKCLVALPQCVSIQRKWHSLFVCVCVLNAARRRHPSEYAYIKEWKDDTNKCKEQIGLYVSFVEERMPCLLTINNAHARSSLSCETHKNQKVWGKFHFHLFK